MEAAGSHITTRPLSFLRVQTFTGSTYGVRRLSFPSSFIEPGVYMLQLTLVGPRTAFTSSSLQRPASPQLRRRHGCPAKHVLGHGHLPPPPLWHLSLSDAHGVGCCTALPDLIT